jgi:elongation factor Ts
MAVSSEQVKLLREKTGAGMMDCKRALEESGGDMDKAVEILRKKGAATAQKRADRMAKEGAIVTRVSVAGRTGIVVEVNCETDFVARGEDFLSFANFVAETIEQHKPESVEELMGLAPGGKKLSERLNELVGKVGEKVDVRRFGVYESKDGMIGAYTHMGSKIGVLVELAGTISPNDAVSMSRDMAMQIAAMNPQYVKRDDVPKEVIDREMEIYRTQARNEGKPDQVVDRIASGKLEKFYQEVCLMEQAFIKDSTKTIKEFLDGLSVRRYERYHLGEN